MSTVQSRFQNAVGINIQTFSRRLPIRLRGRATLLIFCVALVVLFPFGHSFAWGKVVKIGVRFFDLLQVCRTFEFRGQTESFIGNALIEKRELSTHVVAKCVTVFKCPCQHKNLMGFHLSSNAFLREFDNIDHVKGVAGDYLSIFAKRTILGLSTPSPCQRIIEFVNRFELGEVRRGGESNNRGHHPPVELSGHMPAILEIDDDPGIVLGVIRHNKIGNRSVFLPNRDGRSLAHLEALTVKIIGIYHGPPHAETYNRIPYSENDSDSFKYFPPLDCLLISLIGIAGIFWRVGSERATVMGATVFVCGCILWAYSCGRLLLFFSKS